MWEKNCSGGEINYHPLGHCLDVNVNSNEVHQSGGEQRVSCVFINMYQFLSKNKETFFHLKLARGENWPLRGSGQSEKLKVFNPGL